MPAIEIPGPAVITPREVIEFTISQHLAEFGKHSLVTRTWRWIHRYAPHTVGRTQQGPVHLLVVHS